MADVVDAQARRVVVRDRGSARGVADDNSRSVRRSVELGRRQVQRERLTVLDDGVVIDRHRDSGREGSRRDRGKEAADLRVVRPHQSGRSVGSIDQHRQVLAGHLVRSDREGKRSILGDRDIVDAQTRRIVVGNGRGPGGVADDDASCVRSSVERGCRQIQREGLVVLHDGVVVDRDRDGGRGRSRHDRGEHSSELRVIRTDQSGRSVGGIDHHRQVLAGDFVGGDCEREGSILGDGDVIDAEACHVVIGNCSGDCRQSANVVVASGGDRESDCLVVLDDRVRDWIDRYHCRCRAICERDCPGRRREACGSAHRVIGCQSRRASDGEVHRQSANGAPGASERVQQRASGVF